MGLISIFTHQTREFVPVTATSHPNQVAAAQALASGSSGPFVTMTNEGQKVTKKANGQDLGIMLSGMAQEVQSKAAKEHCRQLAGAPAPRKEPFRPRGRSGLSTRDLPKR